MIDAKLYTYIMTVDSGLAPNPFWGYCTLSVCTPNHTGSKIRPGDYIAGFTTKKEGYKLVYMMQVCEKLRMDTYFSDSRFQQKKPRDNQTWKEKCGDNLYTEISPNEWIAPYNPYHEDHLEIDTKNPFVYIGKRFWYFGEKCIEVPKKFGRLMGGRGVRVNHDENTKNSFIDWVIGNHPLGLHGLPRHRDDGSGNTMASCLNCTSCSPTFSCMPP